MILLCFPFFSERLMDNSVKNCISMIKKQLRITWFCRKIGFTIDHIRHLLKNNTLTINSGKLFSPEHNRKFEVSNAKIKIENEPNNYNKLMVNINGMNILEWFRNKQKEFLKNIGIHMNIKNGSRLKL